MEFGTKDWSHTIEKLTRLLGKKPDIYSILFLIGVNELGKGIRKFSKKEKENLIHIAVCKLCSYEDYYEFTHRDKEGWPHWRPLKKIPFTGIKEQEEFLKSYIIYYFREEVKNFN